MKITAFILLAACLHVGARGLGQDVNLSLKNAPLEKVFSELRRQTGYAFFYDLQEIRQARPVTIELKNKSLPEALELCLKGQPLTYSIVGKTVVIKPSPTVALQPTVIPPPIDVRGRIVNEAGEPVAGASVQVKSDKTKGTSTDANGYFELKGVDENATLLISGVNIETREINVEARTNLETVIVKVSIREGENITIVSTGYQELPKERATGSFTKIDNELFNRKVGTDIISRLDGVTSGLLFDKRDQNNVKLQLRGLYTLTTGIAQPLIILDNFPYEGDLNDINPNDVENITILKDAAAASIWGAKAGNGVIVITTKKGSFNQPVQVSVNSNITIQGKPDLLDIPIISTEDYIELEKFLFSKKAFFADTASASKPSFTPVYEILFKKMKGQISDSEAEAQINALKNYDVRNDFLKYIYRRAISQQYSVNLKGGSSIYKYYFSVGYDKNLNGLSGDDYQRVSLRYDNTIKPFKNLQIDIGLFYTNSNSQTNSPGGYGSNAYSLGNKPLYPYAKLADEFGNPLSIDTKYREIFTDTAGNGKLLDWKFRPLDELSNNNNKVSNQSLLSRVRFKYNLTKEFSVELNYQLQRNNSESSYDKNINSFYTRDLINRFTNLNTNVPSERNPLPVGGILDYTNGKFTGHSGRGQLNYIRKITKHDISALIGFEIRENSSYSSSSRVYGYDDRLNYVDVDYTKPYPIFAGLGSSQTISSGQFISDNFNRFVSTFGNASYTFLDRYTVSASFRNDASNLFGVKTNDKWKPLWSSGISWTLSKESFYNLDVISFLKLRATYGYNGNVNNGQSALTTITYRAASSQLTNIPYAFLRSFPNPELRWEKIRTLNFGLDFGIQPILTGSIEYYLKKSTDVIALEPLDPTTGIGNINSNSANITGSGMEAQFRFNFFKKKLLKLRSDLLFNYATYKITKHLRPIVEPESQTGWVSNGDFIIPIVGQHPYTVVSFPWAGLDPTTGNPQGYVNGQVSQDYAKIRKNTLADQIIHGPAIPKYHGNLLNSLSWNGLSISLNVTYRFAYYFRRPTISYGTGIFTLTNLHSDFVNRWQKPGDEQYTNVPSMIYPNPSNNRDDFYTNSDITVEKGDHIRLEDIRFAYTFDKQQRTGIPFRQLTVYTYLTNLNALIWKANKKGIDPDNPEGMMPPRSVAIGFNVDF